MKPLQANTHTAHALLLLHLTHMLLCHPSLKKTNCLWCKIEVAKDAIKAQSVSSLIVAENHGEKHTGDGTWFPNLFLTPSLKSGETDLLKSQYQCHYRCLQRILKGIKNT